MAVNGISNMINSRLRLTGMASGLDTDTIISSLMKIERAPLDKVMQKKQLAEWKRDDYREITNLLRGLKDEFFDVLKPSSYMLSQNSYKKFSVSSTDSTVVTATGGAEGSMGSHKITVTNLATAATAKSGDSVTKALESTDIITSGADSDVVNASGKKIKITLDGITKEITLGSFTDTSTVADLAQDIENKIGVEFGTGKVTVGETVAGSGKLVFSTTGGASRLTIESGSTNSGLDYINIKPGTSNRLNTSDTIATLKDKLKTSFDYKTDTENVEVTINSKTFIFSKDTTLSSMMSTINSDSTAKVNMTYDEVSDKFILTSKQTGAGNSIDISEASSTFMASVALDSGNANYTSGEDAQLILDGQNVTRSSNTFTSNGVTYTLLKESATEQTVSLKPDVDAVYNNIKNFIDKYNNVIETINNKLSEKYDRDYQPLTDEQKEAMSDEDIARWEKKAKTGLLRNDDLLESIVYNMRTALFESVKGVTTTLSSIGINTKTYSDKGKLTIDETKLKEAISKDPDGVMNLFSKQSTSQSSYSRDLTSDQRKTRYQEEGLAQRLSDILEDNISTFRDINGNKGKLLQKAGITGDASEYSNTIYDQIKGYNTKIADLADMLADKEDRYYEKYARLEELMSKMNSQSSWLSSQLGQGQ